MEPDEFKPAFERLTRDSLFAKWKALHESCYFSYALAMSGEGEEQLWHFGFYDKAEDRVTSFSVGKSVSVQEESSEVFKAPEHIVKEIELDKIKISLKDVLLGVKAFLKENYPSEIPLKVIVNLHYSEDFGTVGNISFFMRSFNIVNLKAGTSTGEVPAFR